MVKHGTTNAKLALVTTAGLLVSKKPVIAMPSKILITSMMMIAQIITILTKKTLLQNVVLNVLLKKNQT
jgi:hypothetical protein